MMADANGGEGTMHFRSLLKRIAEAFGWRASNVDTRNKRQLESLAFKKNRETDLEADDPECLSYFGRQVDLMEQIDAGILTSEERNDLGVCLQSEGEDVAADKLTPEEEAAIAELSKDFDAFIKESEK